MRSNSKLFDKVEATMEETISLKEIFATLKKRLLLIITITLLATIISAIFTFFFITPQYSASTQILVNQQSSKDSLYNQNAVQTNVQLVNTYSGIVKSPIILNQVIKDLNLDYSAEALQSMISVETVQNAQYFNVTVKNTDPAEAVQIANKTASIFKTQIKKIMKVDNVTVLSKANLASSENPVSPNPKMNMAIAFVVGLMISVGLAFLLEYLDNTVKTEDDLEKLLGLPVLGTISEISADQHHVKKTSHAAHTQARGDHLEA